MLATTEACSTNFRTSNLARAIVVFSAAIMLLVLILIYHYGAYSQALAALFLLPFVVIVHALLFRKASYHSGHLILHSDGQLSVQYADNLLAGQIGKPIWLSDWCLWIGINCRSERHLFVLMSDTIAPADFRRLSAMLHQIRATAGSPE